MWPFSKVRSADLAGRLAEIVGGRVHPCRASFGLWKTARHCVKAGYAGMQLEVYVFDPWLEVWVQDFRLRANGEVAFSVNAPQRLMALVARIPDVAAAGRPVFRRPWERDETAVRAFCADPGNARGLAALRLGPGESVAVLSHQVIVRLRAGDDAQLRARFDLLGALCRRNARPVGPRAAALEPFDITVGEPGEERGVERAARHRFGGAIEDGPPCRNCRRPLHRLLSLDMQAPPLAAAWSGPGRVPVATCLGCQVLSSPLVLAHGPSGWAIREQASSPSFDEFPAALPERPIRLEPAPADRAEPARHRVGGAPGWIQSDETPDCVGCGHPMTFLAQLDTDERLGLQFGDDGRLYAFVCPRCVTVATLIQST